VAVLLSAASAGQQAATARAGWPCGASIDPSYFHVAEATGGQLLLLAPAEIAGAADLLLAFNRHPETLLRLGGMISAGSHEFRIPIDSSIESLLFSISVQCMGAAEVIRPSGAPAAGANVTERSGFVAERMVIVDRPEPGLWIVRAGGSGLAGVMVTARSSLRLADVAFAAAGSDDFTSTPRAGGENVVRIGLTGAAAQVEAAMVNAASKELARFAVAPDKADGVYVGRFTPGAEPFRVMITGQDAAGAAFQRVYARLLTAR